MLFLEENVGHYTCQRYNGKSTIDYVLHIICHSYPIYKYFHVDVFDKSLSDAHSPICLDLIFENTTRKHIKNIFDYENGNKKNIHFI